MSVAVDYIQEPLSIGFPENSSAKGVDLVISVQDRVIDWGSGGDWKGKWLAELQQRFGGIIRGELLYWAMGDGKP